MFKFYVVHPSTFRLPRLVPTHLKIYTWQTDRGEDAQWKIPYDSVPQGSFTYEIWMTLPSFQFFNFFELRSSKF